MNGTIRVGTRESALAMAQSRLIVNLLESRFSGLKFELVGMKTRGDVLLDTRLDLIGGKGLFVNEIENALIEDKIDMAVHSMKDMPAVMPGQLTIAAVSEREDPRDVLVTTNGQSLKELRTGAVVGTSSIRREVQLLALRPDLNVRQLRGNVLTRLDKLGAGEYDAIVLAAAGLKRLGLHEKCGCCFPVEEMIPAIGQGILGVQVRKGGKMQELVNSINSPDTWLALEAERSFMIRLNGGCSTPVAAHAVISGNEMKITGMLAVNDGKTVLRAAVEGDKRQTPTLGERLADLMVQNQINMGDC
ncbi:hydroxymethylbilane synthase [Ruminiclostridium cellobioparum]|uniref:Porphobilinogen deaminase n=1 Tax=Ruminiclostridium cellobioparum subsp. termitidis CT1112 TaxID=1195236 RepID=S0FHB8_RUMCE|nr:hydroxymethylbilane synthase [Ruminiclostridium cellobioparum]EMS71105.1 porphobilinogen deaminase [Ruminiclostridium cellobioparum subsp. termitidis CT1112]